MSDSIKSNRLTTDPTLADHKRHKKRLIAPWNQHKYPYRSTDWCRHRLPEIIWIAEVMSEVGHDLCHELVVQLFKSTRAADAKSFPELASYWGVAPTKVLECCVADMESSRVFEPLLNALRGFCCIHPDYPLFRLFEKQPPDSCRTSYANDFVSRLVPLLSRYSVASVQLHAHVVLAKARTGSLHLNSDSLISNLDAIFCANPNEEDPKFLMGAGSARATFGACFGAVSEEIEMTAPRVFWQRNLELGPCISDPPPWEESDDGD
jgi:hypothetical protein